MARHTIAAASDTPDSGDSEGAFTFLRRKAKKLGKGLLEQCVTAYMVMTDRDTPAKAKAVLAGALAYVVLPADAIPDVLPVIGWTDDAMAITTALAAVAVSIKPEHRVRARDILRSWGVGFA